METMGIKATEEILKLSQQYGILNVVLIIVLFFMGGLIIYVLRQSREREIEQAKENMRRDDRWASLIERMEEKANERHDSNQKSMNILSEADRRQREEHDVFMKQLIEYGKHREVIIRILDKISLRLDIKEGISA